MADDGKPMGYRNPPHSTRFKPGQSGNPRGRPKNRHRDELPHEDVLGQMVTVTENGVQSQMTAEEALLRKMAISGVSRDSVTAIDLLKTLEALGSNDASNAKIVIEAIKWLAVDINPNLALEYLGMATPLYRNQPNAHMAIEPWLVEEALARLGDRRFTRAEQQTIVEATRTPHKVKWPDWWEAIPPKRR